MIERKKAEALAYIRQFHLLSQVRELEQAALDRLIDEVIALPDEMEQWHAYVLLKDRVRGIVGFEARRAELASTSHYQLMMVFLDWLLSKKRYSVARLEDDEEERIGE